MAKQVPCAVCGAPAEKQVKYDPTSVVFHCPVCGKYQYILESELNRFNINHLASYLAHNGFLANQFDYRYFTTMSKEKCDEYKKEFEEGDTSHGHPVHLSVENVENWYPITFAEKVDYILLYLNKHTPYMGAEIYFSEDQIYSWLFVDRYDCQIIPPSERSADEKNTQALYMYEYLKEQGYIYVGRGTKDVIQSHSFTLSPKGYSRIEELQRNTAYGKLVLVAMQFGQETKPLREAIRKGVSEAGYLPRFIDEFEHNNQITPELLKQIKNSKFVVVDLSHQNNGAYFEEGYAMGLGKPVIQLCKEGVKLHFDIAQKNTIIWETESDIPERLKNRIIATID